ncbi:hypothetical protein ACQSSU_06520 [Micromonospora echinospora]
MSRNSRWTTTRSAAAEFGPPPAARYPELADYSDAELMSRPIAEILAEIETSRAIGSAIHRLNTDPMEVAR